MALAAESASVAGLVLGPVVVLGLAVELVSPWVEGLE